MFPVMTEDQFEMLSAYADGELGETRRRQIERLLETDPLAREALSAIQGSHSRLRQAYLPTYHADLPERLMRVLTIPGERARPVLSLRWLFAGSAGSAALAGILAGWFGAVTLQTAKIEPPVMVASASGLEAGEPLAAFLASVPSGTVSDVAGQPSAVLLSFQSDDGRACRQFQTGAIMAVGCKQDDETWTIEATAQATPLAAGGYVTASGEVPAGIEAAVTALGVNEVYDASREREAMAKGWN
jgi:hypothetical protein